MKQVAVIAIGVIAGLIIVAQLKKVPGATVLLGP